MKEKEIILIGIIIGFMIEGALFLVFLNGMSRVNLIANDCNYNICPSFKATYTHTEYGICYCQKPDGQIILYQSEYH